MTREHWRNHPAQVVWLLIYPTAEDERNNNWLCSSEWISNGLASEFRPTSDGGDDISQGLKIRWNNNYLVESRWNTNNTIDKDNYLKLAANLIETTSLIISKAEAFSESYRNAEINFADCDKNMPLLYKQMDKVYGSGLEIGFPPFECKDISIKFQSLIAYAHNALLPFRCIGQSMREARLG